MICKTVNYDLALQEWDHLINSGKLNAEQMTLAKAYRTGVYTEKEMAYYLAFHLTRENGFKVFNNLKFDIQGFTAQIDHLVLTRWSAYFIETKSVGHKININEFGQWARVYGRKYKPIESPIEQSRRHEVALMDLLQENKPQFMGKILGMQKGFRNLLQIEHLVAVSVKAQIGGRGKRQVKDYLYPLDQIPQRIIDNHAKVNTTLMKEMLREAISDNKKSKKKNDRRLPAFSVEELNKCCDLITHLDQADTPLNIAHQFINQLDIEAVNLQGSSSKEPEMNSQAIEPIAVESKHESIQASPQVTQQQETLSEHASPPCPKCGSEMILRTAKKGKRDGQQFWGCSQFPKCRGTINL